MKTDIGIIDAPNGETIVAVHQFNHRLFIFTPSATYRTIKIRKRWRDAHKIPVLDRWLGMAAPKLMEVTR